MEDISGEGELKDLPLLTNPWLLFSVWSGILFKISLFRRKEYEGYANADFLFKYYWMAGSPGKSQSQLLYYPQTNTRLLWFLKILSSKKIDFFTKK